MPTSAPSARAAAPSSAASAPTAQASSSAARGGRTGEIRCADTRGARVPRRGARVSHAVVLSAVRTPVGRYAGALSDVRPDDLAAAAIAAAVERAGVDAAQIEDVYLGCANQAGEDNRNVARMAALLAGLPQSVAGVTVNRLCASGLSAVVSACHAIVAGDGDLFVAGGVESMSRAPLVQAKPERAFPRGNQIVYDTTLGWRFPNPRMEELFPLESMGETGENVAERYGVTREDQDAFALESQRRWAAASRGGPVRRRARRPRRRRARRASPPRHDAGEARCPRAVVPPERLRDRGQLQRDQRRRRSARDRQRGEGARARRAAARKLRRQRRRRSRPAGDGHRPRARGPQAPRAQRSGTAPTSTSSSSTRRSPRRAWW